MRTFAVMLFVAAPLTVSLACSHVPPSLSLDRCPPRATVADSSGPRLVAGGKGVAAREEPPTADEGTAGPASARLVSGGRGVPERVDPAPQRGMTASATPHLVAGGRGVAPRMECE